MITIKQIRPTVGDDRMNQKTRPLLPNQRDVVDLAGHRDYPATRAIKTTSQSLQTYTNPQSSDFLLRSRIGESDHSNGEHNKPRIHRLR
ncbi:hypothetical protein O181_033793 [Austropuccinia psidii MF-1]|uniref:Uncharacterized protein n=1 Tax=Austropuccinia psidii MF-1 TaxID=1389203 RepID=A0A9Q3H6S5_9BASI|nr:hypothetical protein [Austropuccinia psidii MF-1]